MDDQPAKNPSEDKINKIDLSAFEDFEFGTQWSKASSGTREGRSAPARPGRGRSSESGGAAPRRDRRPSRQAQGSESRGTSQAGQRAGGHARPDRRGDFPRSNSREGDDRGQRGRGGMRSDFRGRGPSGPPRPYQSPVFEVTFYPDDHGFNALVKAMRASCRTYELFEIARLILGKPERCVVVFRRRKASPDAASEPLFVSVPDGMPFDTEDEAIRYALDKHMGSFFTMEAVEVEPPKGTFQFVNRCPVTKTLLGPPNYHRYPHILRNHYDTHAIRTPFEEYKASIEVVREPEAVEQWLESTKKVTRYTFNGPEGSEPVVFDSPEEARNHLLSNCREQVVRASDTTRLSAKTVTESNQTEAARALQGAIDMQRRFPLDTANALRGRLRRENFHIFKRGSKGVTYVCSVRRKFRKPGEVFSESITKLVEFLDKNPRIVISDLPEKFLGFSLPHEAPVPATVAAASPPVETDSATTAEPVEVAEPTPGTEPAKVAEGPAAAVPEVPEAPQPESMGLTSEQKSALNRLLMDLRWLVGEGYVAEYSDGRLYAHPVVEPVQAKPASKPDVGKTKESQPPVTAESATAPEPAAAEDASPDPEPAAMEEKASPDVEPAVEKSSLPTEEPTSTEATPAAAVEESTSTPVSEPIESIEPPEETTEPSAVDVPSEEPAKPRK